MVLDSFMESYRSNVVIKGDETNMAAFFEGAQPCSYEDAIETFFEAQYSVEAMAAITENAILMESAGAADMINEGVIGSFFEAAIEKIKECAKKVKDFAVACVKRVIQFFKDLYDKATPIDKIMQQYGKKGVDYSDIKTAMANGFKIPGSLKLLVADPQSKFDEIMKEFSFDNTKVKSLINDTEKYATTKERVDAIVDGIKEDLNKIKEEDKERFNWVGRLLSDNDEYSKKTMRGKFIKTANEDKSKDGDIDPKEWDALKDYALNGQAKQRTYRREIEDTAKKSVKEIDEVAKQVNKMQSDNVRNAADDDKSAAADKKALVSKLVAAKVAQGTYMANRSVMVMSKVIIPTMRKMHTTAISSFIYITNGTKSKNKKTDKKAGIK